MKPENILCLLSLLKVIREVQNFTLFIDSKEYKAIWSTKKINTLGFPLILC